MTRSAPTNQVQTKINIAKALKTCLNVSKKYHTTNQGFETYIVIVEYLGKYWYIFNKWRILFKHAYLLKRLPVKV